MVSVSKWLRSPSHRDPLSQGDTAGSQAQNFMTMEMAWRFQRTIHLIPLG